jgi:hypothetical protein
MGNKVVNIYCLGLLNKFATMEATNKASFRTSLLSIYFGFFNKLLHQNPELKVDLEQETKKLKKDRSISKKQREQQLKKFQRHKKIEVDVEDYKVVELLLMSGLITLNFVTSWYLRYITRL